VRVAAALLVVLALGLAGCGGGGDEGKPAQSQAPAEEGAPVPSEPTPENCMLKAGLESVEKPDKRTWIALHPDGYEVRVKRFGSPAAANQAVQSATGLAEQANFFGVFASTEDQLNRKSLAVARCLREF
jgi:hypothetical protein